MDEELELLFDPDPFIASVEKMSASFDKFCNKMDKKQEITQKNTIKTSKTSSGEIFKAFSKLAIIGTLFVGIYKGVKNLVSHIPEIGTVFKIAGDIFMRNFLWPLRRMLIPMLNGLLRWVRDSRVMFIQWGSVLVNIFIVVKNIISVAINMIRGLIDGFLEGIRKGTGATFKDITELINLTLFKIAIILAFVSVKLKKIMPTLKGIMSAITVDIIKFSKGFAKAFSKIGVGFFEDFASTLEKIENILTRLTPAMEILGKIIGTAIITPLRIMMMVLNNILGLFSDLLDMSAKKMSKEDFFKKFSEGFKKNVGEIEDIFKGIGETFKNENKETNKQETPKKTFTKDIETKDAIIKPNGQIIRPDPSDTIITTKNPGKINNNNKNIVLNMSNNYNITTTEGNAKKTGENIAIGLMEKIRMGLENEYVLQGNR